MMHANHSEYILTSSYLIPILIAHQFLSNQHVSASRWSLQESAYRMPQLFCHRTFSWGAFHRSHHWRATLQTARDGGKQLRLGQKVQTQRHLWWHVDRIWHIYHHIHSPYSETPPGHRIQIDSDTVCIGVGIMNKFDTVSLFWYWYMSTHIGCMYKLINKPCYLLLLRCRNCQVLPGTEVNSAVPAENTLRWQPVWASLHSEDFSHLWEHLSPKRGQKVN